MHEVLVNRLGGLSLPRKSVVRLTDRPDMTLDVYRGRKTTIQPTNQPTGRRRCSAVSRKTACNFCAPLGFFVKVLIETNINISNEKNEIHSLSKLLFV